MIRRWRRTDEPQLEVLRLRLHSDGVDAHSWVVHAGRAPFVLHYAWSLDEHWSTRALRLELHAERSRSLLIERTGRASWTLDGNQRPDLDGCVEIDVSATPFCNALAVRHLRGRSGELTTVYVDVPELSATPSRQRYEALGAGRWRYVDLGVAAGFEARLDLDDAGLVARYQGLFELLPDDG
jgi:uncharacterized protein